MGEDGILVRLIVIVLVLSVPVVSSASYRLDYDANGNLIYDEETDLFREYDGFNRLSKIRLSNATGLVLQEFTWDFLEERILIKKEWYRNGTWKHTIRYPWRDFISIKNASGVWNETYVYQGDMLVGVYKADGRKLWVLTDHLGTAHTFLDEKGNIVESTLYSPYGEVLDDSAARYGYEAREFDTLTQDTDFLFRKYNPSNGRFTQPDTLLPNVYDPQQLNRYTFERNNPMKHTDPDGHLIPLLVWGGLAAYSWSSVSYLRTQEAAEASPWARVGKSAAHGAVGASSAVATFATLAPMGRIAASTGKAATVTSAKLFGIGAAESATHDLIDGEIPDPSKAGVSGSFNSLLPSAFRTQPGSFVSNRDLFSRNSGKLFSDYLIGLGLEASFGSTAAGYITASYNTMAGNSGLRLSQGSSSFEYVTQDGRIYPTNNPNWEPKSSQGFSKVEGSNKCIAYGNAACPT